MTQGAVAAEPGEGVTDLAGAAVWGLVRSAQSENPGRLVLADLPGRATRGRRGVLAAALGSGEPELAVRDGHGVRPAAGAPGRRVLAPPDGGGPWRLDVTERGTLDSLALVACPQAAAPLEAGQVRVAVRAAGLNFRDVLIGLDMYPGAAVMGGEIAGIVTRDRAGRDRAGGRGPGARPGRGRVRAGRGDRCAAAGAGPGGLVVRAGRVRAGGVRDGVVCAGGPGRGPGRAAAAGARGLGRGGDGRGGDRPASGPGGLRHRQPGQASCAGRDGPGRAHLSPPRAPRSSRASSWPPPAGPGWTSC